MRFPRTSALLKGALIVMLTVLACLPAMRGGFIWDDDYVTEYKTLPEPGGWQRIWTDTRAPRQYDPLVHTMFCLEYQAWGLKPFGGHPVNVLVRLSLSGAWRAAPGPAPVLFGLVVTGGALPWQPARMYQTLETLWRGNIRKNPGCGMGLDNLALIRKVAGDTREAEVLYQAVLKFRPDYAEAHRNFAVELIPAGRRAAAREPLQAALRLNPDCAAAKSQLPML